MSIFDHFSAKDRGILQARAERAARLAQDNTQDDLMTLLVVTLGQERYALPIEDIANIYEDMLITPVPCVPSFVAGVANIRGHIMLALDLAALLGVPDEIKPETATLAVLADNELEAAVQVGSIRGVESVTASDLAAIPANVELNHSAYVRGILPDGTVLLDIGSILNDPALIVSIEQP